MTSALHPSCLSPAQVEGEGVLMIAGWLRSVPSVVKATRRQQVVGSNPITDPRWVWMAGVEDDGCGGW